jgi:hypothetical protein
MPGRGYAAPAPPAAATARPGVSGTPRGPARAGVGLESAGCMERRGRAGRRPPDARPAAPRTAGKAKHAPVASQSTGASWSASTPAALPSDSTWARGGGGGGGAGGHWKGKAAMARPCVTRLSAAMPARLLGAGACLGRAPSRRHPGRPPTPASPARPLRAAARQPGLLGWRGCAPAPQSANSRAPSEAGVPGAHAPTHPPTPRCVRGTPIGWAAGYSRGVRTSGRRGIVSRASGPAPTSSELRGWWGVPRWCGAGPQLMAPPARLQPRGARAAPAPSDDGGAEVGGGGRCCPRDPVQRRLIRDTAVLVRELMPGAAAAPFPRFLAGARDLSEPWSAVRANAKESTATYEASTHACSASGAARQWSPGLVTAAPVSGECTAPQTRPTPQPSAAAENVECPSGPQTKRDKNAFIDAFLWPQFGLRHHVAAAASRRHSPAPHPHS